MFSERTCCDLLLPYRDVQQLVNQGLLVHHVGHIWHVETVELGAVLENDVSNLGYQHTLSQPQLQVHEEPGKKQKKPPRQHYSQQKQDKHGGFQICRAHFSLAALIGRMLENKMWCSIRGRVRLRAFDA